jgi:hypothetical protein
MLSDTQITPKSDSEAAEIVMWWVFWLSCDGDYSMTMMMDSMTMAMSSSFARGLKKVSQRFKFCSYHNQTTSCISATRHSLKPGHFLEQVSSRAKLMKFCSRSVARLLMNSPSQALFAVPSIT